MLEKLRRNHLLLRDYVIYVFARGVWPLLRGLPLFVYNRGRLGFPFFKGQSTRVLHSHLIKASPFFYIGDFSYINCLSTGGLRVGRRVTLREYCWLQITSTTDNLGEGIVIGDHTYIGPRCNLGAAALLEIGNRCQIGAGVSFIAENHLFQGGTEIFDQGVSRKGIRVGDDCWIGNNAIVLDGVTIGNGAVIGAGAVVTKSLPTGAIAVGVPARVISMRRMPNVNSQLI